jgi:RNA polymerase sigma factor (sigma-70 family)
MTENDLKQYQAIVREMSQVQNKIKELECMKYTIKSPTWSDMPKGSLGNHNKLENILIDIEEQTEKYWDKYGQLLELQNKIENAIENLEPLEREVLRYRYFNNKKFEEISCIINYSFRTVRRIHKRGIEKIEKSS